MNAIRSLLPMKPADLAASLAVHALLVLGVVVAGRWLGSDSAGVVQPPRLLWVSLAGGAPGEDPSGPPAGARPVAEPQEPAATRVPPTAPSVPTVMRPAPPSGLASASATPSAPAPPPASAVRARPAAPEPSPSAVRAAVRADAPAASSSGAGAARAAVPAVAAGGGPPAWPGSGQVDRAARPRWPIRPDYPPLERQRGRESTVVVEAWVDAKGDVTFSSVARSGGEDFDASARRAVEGSSFQPARLDGRDVASRVALRIHFELYD